MSRTYPIRRRLQMVIVLTSSLALALSCAIFIFFEWRNSLAKERQVILSLGQIAANASSAALAFASVAEAQKVLMAFRGESDIRAAALYDANGRIFASYLASGSTQPPPSEPEPDGLTKRDDRLILFRPVAEGQKRYGTLYVRVDLRDMYARMSRYWGSALLIFCGTLAAAYGIGRVLQRRVSEPILQLAETARSISQDHNYSVRARKMPEGELGLLTDAFNQMLEEIQQQQLQLRQELTERKRAQDAEAREKRLLGTTLASIGDAVIVTDAAGEVTFLNGEAERLTGWKNEQAAGLPLPKVFRIINEHTREPAEDPVAKVLRLGAVVSLANHTILIAKDGTETPIDDSAAPIRQPDGLLSGVVLVFRDFTEQKKSQEARARLAAIVESSGDAIYTKNLEGIIQTWNASAQRLFGYEPAEIIGKPITTLIPADRLEEEKEIFARLRQGEPAERIETFRISRDGRRIPVSLSISPLKDTEGRVTGASTINHDISEVIAAREALIHEKELLGTTLASIGDGVIITDAQGKVTLLNREAEHLTGWKSVEATGQPLSNVFRIFNERTREPVELPTDKVLRLGTSVGLANHTALLRRDGTELPIDDSAAPIQRTGGPLLGVVLVFRDFTERKDAERRLRESEERFRAVAENIPQLAWMTDPAGSILWYNRRWLEYTGTTLEQMQGTGWELVHHPDHATRVLARWKQALKKGMPWEDIFPLRGRDGKFRWFLSRAFPIRDGNGTISRWFGTNTDVTELREAQEALQQAKDDLQQHAARLEATVADRTAKLLETVGELEAFSYSIAHDMRAPLRAMQGFSTLLREEYGESIGDDGKDYLRRIAASANRLDHLIQDVLNYSKIVRAEVNLEPMNTHAFIKEIIQSYPNLYPNQAHIELDPNIPPVMANPAALTQVVSNLLGNAVKFVKPGVMPRVRIWAETREDAQSRRWVRLWFEDNGIGIRREVHDRIFLMFQRLNPPGEYEGTGIGLTIVRKAVERMGGEVGVESEPGKGSKFWIQLKPANLK